jgi:hypothetical protein
MLIGSSLLACDHIDSGQKGAMISLVAVLSFRLLIILIVIL